MDTGREWQLITIFGKDKRAAIRTWRVRRSKRSALDNRSKIKTQDIRLIILIAQKLINLSAARQAKKLFDYWNNWHYSLPVKRKVLPG
jgi:hypothetical protein